MCFVNLINVNKMNDTIKYSEPQVLLSTDFLSSLPYWTYYVLCISFEFSQELIQFFGTVVFGLCNFVGLYLVVGFVSYLVLSNHRTIQPRRRVMFITAHPDDEVLFFGPTIIRLKETCDIYLLCLSKGNMYGREMERKKELWDCCKVLGIPASNIMLFSHPEFPDDPKVIWSAKKAYGFLYFHIDAYGIQEVYTFDIDGVSGHLNHISIFYAVARMCMKKRIPSYCKIYLLETVNKMRKYSAYFDATTSFSPMHERVFMASWSETKLLREAMRAHQSQMVWFRTLYIYFSRYMYINTFRELNQDDVQLVLQMNEYKHQ